MLCSEFEDRIDLLLDLRRLPEQDAALLAHARICPHCEQRMATQYSLFVGLEQARIPEVSPRFTQHVLGSVGKEPGQRRVSGRLRILAIAASLLTVLGATAWISQRPAATDPHAAVTPPIHNSAPHSDAETQPVTIRIEPGSAEDANPAGNHIAESPEPTGFPGFPGSFSGLGLGFANLPQRKQVDEIAGGLRPIADGFEAAIDALKSTVRSNKEPRRNKPQAEIHRGVWSRSLA